MCAKMSIEEKLKEDFYLRINKSESPALYCEFKRFQYFEHLFRICWLLACWPLSRAIDDVDQSRFRGDWDFAKKRKERETEKWLDE